MDEAVQTLREANTILVVDWPSADVPESLTRVGRRVIVKGGPGPRDYSVRELRDGEMVARPLGEPPDRIDLVYAHRPEAELPGIISMAKQLGARTLWWQTGMSDADSKDPRGCWVSETQSRRGRELAESEGLDYVDDVYIGDAARAVGAPQ